MNNFSIFGIAALIALAAGCSKQEEQQTQAPQKPAAAAEPAAKDPHAGVRMAAAPAAGARNQGRVLFVAQTGSYTYLQVESDGRKVWLASGHADVAAGDTVAWGDSAVMRNFKSKALDRTFDEILFVAGVTPVNAVDTQRGTVASVTHTETYSFIEVDLGGEKKWLAAPVVTLKAGDTVSWSGGTVMSNFTSESVNRTFDEIVFVGKVNVVN